MSHEQADSALADMIWWFRGFRAATVNSDPLAPTDQTFDLAGAALTTRTWLKRLARGKARLLGINDSERAIVLTEAEFDTIFDGLREGAIDCVLPARELVMRVLREFQAEANELRRGGVDF